MNDSISKLRASLAEEPTYKDEESRPDNGEYRVNVPQKQIEGRHWMGKEKGVNCERETSEAHQEQGHSPPPALALNKVSSSAKESGHEERNSSDRSPESLEQVKDQQSSPTNAAELQPSHPQILPLLIIGLSLSVFLVSLDRTITTTAIPHITNQFHSYSDVGWYGSAYLITASVLQLTYGRIFALFSIKWSYIAAMLVFELGSLICALAPNSTALIVGRAIAGFGSAGVLTGSFVLVAHSVPLQKRPAYTGLVGLWFGVGALLGPLLGGVFTDRATWRWCFYFNLPVGAVTIVVISFFFRAQTDTPSSTLRQKLLDLDPVGNIIILAAAVMFFLALQFGGQAGLWSSARVIGLLTGAGVTLIIFLLWLKWKSDQALIPLKIISQRSVAAASGMSFFVYSTLLVHVYFLPIWFQAIKGDSAVTSGVHMIPYVAANALFSLAAGIFVTKIGYFAPPSIVGCAIGVAGGALLSTLQVNTASAKWIGYEILTSVGLGIVIQQGIIQCKRLGGAVFVSVGNSVLQNELVRAVDASPIPGVDVRAVVSAGATQFRSFVPEAALPALLEAYNHALQRVLIAAIATSGLAFFASLGLEWKSVRAKRNSMS
ncbi:efflux pump aflT [Physcia stellaris]|nr:efflux pump aflT [Physcia stellaris]